MSALALIALSSIILVLGEKANSVFLLGALYVGLCYGSSFALYPAQVAQVYGPEVMGSVYSLVLAAQGLAAQVGPPLGGMLYDITDSFVPGMVIAAVVVAAGLVGYAHLERLSRQKPKPVRFD